MNKLLENMNKSKINQDELKRHLFYSPETGVFEWKNKKLGRRKTPGTYTSHGYLKIFINGNTYAAHRLAWLYMYGSLPDSFIDHINRKKSDNRISSLRLVTPEENMKNRKRKVGKTGVTGVYTITGKTFYSRIHANGKSINLGTFESIELAEFAYQEAARLFHTCNAATE